MGDLKPSHGGYAIMTNINFKIITNINFEMITKINFEVLTINITTKHIKTMNKELARTPNTDKILTTKTMNFL